MEKQLKKSNARNRQLWLNFMMNLKCILKKLKVALEQKNNFLIYSIWLNRRLEQRLLLY